MFKWKERKNLWPQSQHTVPIISHTATLALSPTRQQSATGKVFSPRVPLGGAFGLPDVQRAKSLMVYPVPFWGRLNNGHQKTFRFSSLDPINVTLQYLIWFDTDLMKHFTMGKLSRITLNGWVLRPIASVLVQGTGRMESDTHGRGGSSVTGEAGGGGTQPPGKERPQLREDRRNEERTFLQSLWRAHSPARTLILAQWKLFYTLGFQKFERINLFEKINLLERINLGCL